MPLSDKDRQRFSELGVAYACVIDEKQVVVDGALRSALATLHQPHLDDLIEADRREAEDVMLDACKYRIRSMRCKTVEVRRPRR